MLVAKRVSEADGCALVHGELDVVRGLWDIFVCKESHPVSPEREEGARVGHICDILSWVFGTDRRYWFIPAYSEEDLRRMPALQGLEYPSKPELDGQEF
ncbi:hypothetical protein IFM89_039018 [Coptis chinensis]|uniref:Uncharacterized protein n=1 Tax=Coptis chinensis TaxID=261450 RepID=A0A835IHE1_9MAGN|nr:hypothetical protein IFM89_039018 [Coptis chinensis]